MKKWMRRLYSEFRKKKGQTFNGLPFRGNLAHKVLHSE